MYSCLIHSHSGVLVLQIMQIQGHFDHQYLIGVLPAPQDLTGLTIHGILDLSSRACHAIVATGSPRTIIRPAFARGFGLPSVPRHGPFVQQPDGSWQRVVEAYHPSLHVWVQGMHWRVRAVEADTGPYDLILGADWLHEHQALVSIYGKTVSVQAPGGRAVLRFSGHPAILSLEHFVHDPPPSPDYVPESEPEEEEPEEVLDEDIDVDAVLEEADQIVAAEMIVVDDDTDDEELAVDEVIDAESDSDITDVVMLA